MPLVEAVQARYGLSTSDAGLHFLGENAHPKDYRAGYERQDQARHHNDIAPLWRLLTKAA